jgi:hypothetical protein
MAFFELNSGDFGYEKRVGLVVVAGEEFALGDFKNNGFLNKKFVWCALFVHLKL